MTKKKLKQSETIEILRSQINLNPYNPKRHSEQKVKEQKKNIQRVGYLGGITWNRESGNLIDGHRRLKALDLYYGYDGTTQTDYSVKVEAVSLNPSEEKEQMTYMALGNTKADFALIAEYLPEIDYTYAGIDEHDLSLIQSFIPSDEIVTVESYDDLILEVTPDPNEDDDEEVEVTLSAEEKKSRIKEAKQKQIEVAGERYADLNAYITVSFNGAEEKRLFCDILGISEDTKFIQGHKLLEVIE